MGSDPLTVSGMSVMANGGTNAFTLKTSGPFTIPADDPATPEKENEYPVVVEFRPDANEPLGQKTATIQINNSSNTPVFSNACVRGNAGGPLISCLPSTIDFGPVASGIPPSSSPSTSVRSATSSG